MIEIADQLMRELDGRTVDNVFFVKPVFAAAFGPEFISPLADTGVFFLER